MRFQTLRVDRTDHILSVTIDRPDKLNALSDVVLGELAEVCTKASPDLRGMLIAGAGDQLGDVLAEPAEREAFVGRHLAHALDVGAGDERAIYTGRDVGAQEAQRIGLVNAVYATRGAMLGAARETLTVIAQRGPVAVATCKEILRSLEGKSTAAQLAVENAGFGRVFTTDDKREGVTAFLAKRPPSFSGRS